MKINSLRLTNYRNYLNLDLDLNEKINVIYGNNGQGKTNLVEAIAYLSTLKSFRMHKDSVLINKNALFFEIEANIEAFGRKTLLGCRLTSKEKNKFINGNEVERNSDFIGILNTICFTSNDVWMFKDISQRRYFIDSELSKISPSYCYSLNKYQKLLKERNEFLKQKKIDELYLKVLTKVIAEESFLIINKRKEFISKLNEELSKTFKQLSDDNFKLDVNYQTSFSNVNSVKDIYEKYEKNFEKDILKQVTQIGVHLDDVQVKINGEDIQVFGSQGQQRLAAIALKLSLVKVVERRSGEKPIIIFDDMMSDLDENKRKRLLSSLSQDMQVFITTANVTDIEGFINILDATYYLIEQGSVVDIERK